MAYNRGREERERLFANSAGYQNQFNSHQNKETALDMEGAHHDRLGKANASTYSEMILIKVSSRD